MARKRAGRELHMEEYLLVTLSEKGYVVWANGVHGPDLFTPTGDALDINDFCRQSVGGNWHIKSATFVQGVGELNKWECILARPTVYKVSVQFDGGQSLDALSTVDVMGQRLHDALARKPK
jgi:hypothetical protein